MTRKFFQFALMAALTAGLSLSVTSCKDDDDDNDGRSAEEQAADPYEKETNAGHALFNLLSQLSVMADNELPDNWKDAAFEPVAGAVTDASQPFVRSITVNSLDEAVTRYNSLTGQHITTATQSDTWTMDQLGQMTFTALNQPNCFATIDVNVKQLPQLTQLRFVPLTAIGDNGTFTGDPYYRFGDVVKDPKENTYWICVRPAYSPNGKEDTHWMSFQLTSSNVTDPKKSGCLPQSLPTKLGKDLERMQYLAQLLTIFARPNDANKPDPSLVSFQAQYGNQPFGGGSIGIGGLLQDAMKNDEIIHAAELWIKNDIWNLVKPSSEIDQATFRQSFTKAVSFLYNGYGTSMMNKNVTLYRASYTDPSDFFHAKPDYHDVVLDMTRVKFDVNNKFAKTGQYGDPSFESVGNCYVVRYKTGFQLSTNLFQNPDATKAIPGVQEIYRFNDPKNAKTLTVSENDVKVGNIIGKNGKFYVNVNDAKTDGTEAAAMVVYLGGENRVEKDKSWNGLAIALQDLEVSGRQYATFAAQNNNDEYVSSMVYNAKMYADVLDGCAKTELMYSKNDKYPAAKAVWQTEKVKTADVPVSNWFVPSTGQWILALKGMGYEWKETGTFGSNGHWLWSQAGVAGGDLKTGTADGKYWTANEAPHGMAMALTTNLAYAFSPLGMQENSVRVRPMIAFGSKGTKNPKDVAMPVAPKVGAVLCANGLCFETSDALSEARAVVAYVGADGSVEKDKNWKGLAIGLNNLAYLAKDDCAWASEEAKSGACTSWAKEESQLAALLDGITKTEQLWNGCGNKNHTHNVAIAIKDYNASHAVEEASKWFLPSAGQWILALKGAGLTVENNRFKPESKAGTQKLNDLFKLVGDKLLSKEQTDEDKYEGGICGYWTVNEYAENAEAAERTKAFRINFWETDGGISFDTAPKTTLNFIRPFIAF